MNICALFSHVAHTVAWDPDQGPGVRRQQWERGQGGPGQPSQLRPGEHPELLLQVPFRHCSQSKKAFPDQSTLGERRTGWEAGSSPRWEGRHQRRGAAAPSKMLKSQFY